MKISHSIFLLLLSLSPGIGLISCSVDEGVEESPLIINDQPFNISYQVQNEYPHDTTAFTQGLVYHQGKLYESTGRDSWIGEIDLDTGKPDIKVQLDKTYFGEGITILNDKVYQLTWRNKKGFIYDLNTFETLGEFTYDHEGWGITNDGQNLIISDGTNKLYFVEPHQFGLVRELFVVDEETEVNYLNELEYIDGHIYANQWKTDFILKIDPLNGQVVGKINLSSITTEIKEISKGADVLNGIAYDNETKNLLITGKLWPKLYAIKI
ncbi:MAG: glutaminyl-peptide cyclotransferase [Bacteroidetes bacterium]|nr:glutaminyl-peptide cyclotransferase [Bacteroidota bacterium]MCZ6900391.1 glutaminyl-peptide cyclotransferase [Bacteroidota bacterium]